MEEPKYSKFDPNINYSTNFKIILKILFENSIVSKDKFIKECELIEKSFAILYHMQHIYLLEPIKFKENIQLQIETALFSKSIHLLLSSYLLSLTNFYSSSYGVLRVVHENILTMKYLILNPNKTEEWLKKENLTEEDRNELKKQKSLSKKEFWHSHIMKSIKYSKNIESDLAKFYHTLSSLGSHPSIKGLVHERIPNAKLVYDNLNLILSFIFLLIELYSKLFEGIIGNDKNLADEAEKLIKDIADLIPLPAI